MFPTPFGVSFQWGGSPKEWVHNLLVQVLTLFSSKIVGFQSYFFDTVMARNHHPSYVKHVSASNMPVSPPTWVMKGLEGAPKVLVRNLLM